MSDTSPFLHSQKLMRCQVANRYQEGSVRFVELDSFKLWEYLMTHKHADSIKNISLCLWVSEEEYLDHETVYSHTGEAEPVNRVIVDLYDEEYGFSNIITRFVRSSETDQVIDILKSHLARQSTTPADTQIQTFRGYSIIQNKPTHTRPMMMGLEE